MSPAWAYVALAGACAFPEARGESGPVGSVGGGLVTKTGLYQFEVFFYRTGVRVFPQRPAGTPLPASRFAGTATFYHPNSPKPWFSRPLRAAPSASSLDLVIGLGDAPTAGVKVTLAVDGLPEASEPTASFTVPLEFAAVSVLGDATAVARPRGGMPSLLPRADGLMGYRGLGDLLFTRQGPTFPARALPRSRSTATVSSRPPARGDLYPM